MTELSAQRVRSLAAALLQSVGAPAGIAGEVGDPLAVANPDGTTRSWMVPVVRRGETLLGFVEMTPAGQLLRVSEFGSEQSLAAWVDSKRVASRAQHWIGLDEEAGEPVLTYDAAPARIAWAVPVTVGGVRVATVWVVGDSSYRTDGN